MGTGVIVIEDSGEVRQLLFVESLLRTDELCNASVLVVVGDNFDELWEVIAIPFANTHGEKVDVLVELVEKGNCLDDHIVDTIHVEL